MVHGLEKHKASLKLWLNLHRSFSFGMDWQQNQQLPPRLPHLRRCRPLPKDSPPGSPSERIQHAETPARKHRSKNLSSIRGPRQQSSTYRKGEIHHDQDGMRMMNLLMFVMLQIHAIKSIIGTTPKTFMI